MRMGGSGFCMAKFFVRRVLHDQAARVEKIGYMGKVSKCMPDSG